MKKSIELLVWGTVAFVTVTGACLAALTYLELPELGFNQHGECEWIAEAPEFERRVCPIELPEKYSKTYVWHDDSKGDEY